MMGATARNAADVAMTLNLASDDHCHQPRVADELAGY